MDRVYKEERNYILSLVKKVKASGCNVLLIQKSILRDAVTDLALHYLVRGGHGGGVSSACYCARSVALFTEPCPPSLQRAALGLS